MNGISQFIKAYFEAKVGGVGVYSFTPPLHYTVLDLWTSSPDLFHAHRYPSELFTV
jgi:hypothetical protein